MNFTDANKTMTFLKPELRLFLSNLPEGAFTPRSFLTLVDVHKSEWSERDYTTFFRENFGDCGKYDVIECSVSQLGFIVPLLTNGSKNTRVLILHHNDVSSSASTLINLPTHLIQTYIIVTTESVVIHIGRNDPKAQIYCRRGASFYIHGSTEEASDESYVYRSSFTIPSICKKMLHEVYRTSGDKEKRDVLFRQYGEGDVIGTNSEVYAIVSGDTTTGNASIVSIRAHISEGKGEFVTIEETARLKRNVVLVHGRMSAQGKINMSKDSKARILFADMSQEEVNAIQKDEDRFYGNDRELSSGRGVVGSYIESYLVDGLTISEQLMEERKGPISDDLARCLVYVDNYFAIAIQMVKKPNGLFEAMFTKFGGSRTAAKIKAKRVDVKLGSNVDQVNQSIGSMTDQMLNEDLNRLTHESKIEENYRSTTLRRIEALVRNKNPAIAPYIAETAKGNPKLREEEKFKRDLNITSLDPLVHPRVYYNLPDLTRSGSVVIRDEYYVVLNGENYDCIVHNCGFVILLGVGRVRISGAVHSIVQGRGSVIYEFDNISMIPFPPEIYLYVENGSIFDAIMNFRDKLEPQTVRKLLGFREGEGENSSVPPVKHIGEGEMRRSVVRNLYYLTIPSNHRTAMIENRVSL